MDFSSFLNELRANGYEPVRELQANSSVWPRLRYNGEKTGNASGGYRLIENPDGSLFANYGSSKDPAGWRSWRSNSTKELSWQEIAAAKTARDAHRRYLEGQEQKRHAVVGARLSRVIERSEIAFDHLYLTDKGVDAHGVRLRRKGNELLIPRYDIDGKIYGLQRITQRDPGAKSWKGYFKGARSKGLFYPLFTPGEDMDTIILAEGFSTAASVRECTSLPTVCCFDAGGLRPVAQAFRTKYPCSRLIFAADNNCWLNAKGVVSNTGVDKAQAAAVSIGGAQVVFPEFESDHHPARPTDWNDAMLLYGREYVRNKIMAALEISAPEIPAEMSGEAPAGGNSDPVDAVVQTTGGVADNPTRTGDMGMNFRVLGYNNGNYYYYPFAMRQIVTLSAGGHSINNLVLLDRLESWESRWRSDDGKLSAKHATIALYAWTALKDLADKRGVFQEESMVRGAGGWVDDGRVVLHCGDSIYVDGIYTRFESIKSRFTYVAAPQLMRPALEPLGNHEARRLRTICESITWENQLSGTLLAGWLVVAPICAALMYRPHIYITGEAESGKSTVMDRIIKPVLGKMALCVDGGTTEPAIRSAMGYDARPLIYDEAEPSPAMAEVIGLARKATTGSVVKKFGQRVFKAQFCACFSAINPPVNKTADESRISFMHLKKNRRVTAMQEYDALLNHIEDLITLDFSERLLARTLENMNTLIANIRVFQRAVRQTIGSPRASQQVGTMLAGVYLLGSTAAITEEAAMEIVGRFSWTDHTIIEEEGDPVRLLQWIAGALIRTRSGAEISVGELITMVRIERDAVSDRLLRSYGILVEDDRVKIASTGQNLARLLRDTDWHAKWSRTLSDIPGAQKHKSVYFSPGFKTSAVSVSIDFFSERLDEPEPEGIEF